MQTLNELLRKIDGKKRTLDAHRPLPSPVLRKLKEYFDLEWTYTSNAIEGSTLSRKETLVILKHGLTVKGKSLREHLEVVNHKEAIDCVEKLANLQERISEETIKQIQKLVTMRTIDSENTGEYRQIQVYIAGVKHTPPGPADIPRLMKGFTHWLYSQEANSLHPVQKSSLAHHRFVFIHPFVDGNGRTARLLMNLFLLRDGYPIAIIRETDREDYYKALGEADERNTEGFIQLVAESVDRTMDQYLNSIPKK